MPRDWSDIYFDKQDKDILILVNHILEYRGNKSDDGLFNPNLSPHGIKELAASPVGRMAVAVVNLLRNLETGVGQAKDRLLALEVLYDEVMYSAHSLLRRNTARVLLQIMKELVRSHEDRLQQLKLAHDFRRVVHGTPRIVRKMLTRYHLPEMPESWNQLAFDDHVYDSNTKGRKTPTHLIMDAWIKGIRDITVSYDYYVPTNAARELLKAAEITGITVRIGIEYQVPFYDKMANLVWIPRGFASNEDFLEFLHYPQVIEIMQQGKEVLNWKKNRLLEALQIWNNTSRKHLEEAWAETIPELTTEKFLAGTGQSQPNRQHLAEAIHKHILPTLQNVAEKLSHQNTETASAEIQTLENLGVETILEEWLAPEINPAMQDLMLPALNDSMPDLMRLTPDQLVHKLQDLNPGYRLILGATGLSVIDVAEFLDECQGAVTHLEIFNMKGWIEGKLKDLTAIGDFQQALNHGLGPRIKQMLRQMMRKLENEGDYLRAEKFNEILRNVPKLWEHYRHNPLKSRIGTSSGGRRAYGMGLVIKETLPPRALKELKRSQQLSHSIPICTPVEEAVIYKEPEIPTFWQNLGSKMRWIPGCQHLGMEKHSEWKTASENYKVCKHGNLANLGGLNQGDTNHLLDAKKSSKKSPLGISYLNTNISNWFKVLVGFIPSFISFLYTQDWWFLAWFGTFIWFGITGIRNVIQMVLAAKGFSRGTLIHWKDQVSISRLCDSLMYTGISVLLLEVMIRVWLLQDGFGLTVENDSTLVFTILNIVNGFYICAHNIFRGFPREAAIGNFFRSGLAIPVSSFYNYLFFNVLVFFGVLNPEIYLIPCAAIVSKTASDTVAALIEGYADSHVNTRMRETDYKNKIARVFSCYTRLELLFPQEDALVKLASQGGLKGAGGERGQELEQAFIINALDLMYFWFYLPRAQEVFKKILSAMPKADKHVLVRSQLVLMREREISQMLVDGLLGRNFSPPLAFFLSRHKQYLKINTQLSRGTKHKLHKKLGDHKVGL